MFSDFELELIKKATTNIKNILDLSVCHDESTNKSVVIFDTENILTKILTEAYRNNLKNALFVDFNSLTKTEIINIFDYLNEKDLVVMIQSSNFRLDDFRIRLHLFNHNLKVIEHMHLYRNTEDQWNTYINSLEYDKEYYDKQGNFLFENLSKCNTLEINSLDKKLTIKNGVQIPKLNTGNYSGFKNIGGTFPIGEVFTEAKNFEDMNGFCYIYAFANNNFDITFAKPFWIQIENGLITNIDENAPDEFIEIVKKVKAIETPLIREIGFGLNKAVSKNNPLGDITAFERNVGIHLSLGHKHSVYKTPGIIAHKAKFHIDLFVQSESYELKFSDNNDDIKVVF